MENKEVYDLFKVQVEIKEATEELVSIIVYSEGVASVIDKAGKRAEFDKKIQELIGEMLIAVQEGVENIG